MFSSWHLIVISIAYIGLLFLIAFLGDKYRSKLKDKSQSIIYALTLGVYCTSWSFLGTSGQVAEHLISHLPIYLGPIFLFVFAWPFIQRIIRVSLSLNLTSIADLLASRFGKSHNLAIIVTFVALIGTMPYIALQLKGIVYSFQQLQLGHTVVLWRFGLVVSIVLAGFTILFGIRHIDVTERHPGVMLAIAFESLIKLIAFIAVGLFVCFFLYDSPLDLWQQSNGVERLETALQTPNIFSMFGMLIIVMAAFLSLPRQFQVMVVELKSEKHTWLGRRVFPIYLLIFAVLAIPLGLAGDTLLGSQVPSDSYVLFLPLYEQQAWLTLLTFIGAISAASSMVIISSISLSTMLSNEVVFPLIFKITKTQHSDYNNFRVFLLNVRKALVLLVILSGYGVFLLVSPETLSSMGEVAFGAFAQLTPALIAAFYWRKATLVGAYAGILFGSMMWFMLNFLPQLGLYHHVFESDYLPVNTIATLLSLSTNVFALWLMSTVSRQSVQERVQAALFMNVKGQKVPLNRNKRNINIDELELLVSRFVGSAKAKDSFRGFNIEHDIKLLGQGEYKNVLYQHTENTLASVMGASSARLVLSSTLDGRTIELDELAMLVENVSNEQQQFSYSVLHSAIENAGEGISIIDNNLKLIAWNQQYIDLFHYPSELIYVGSPIESLIRFNVQQGLCGDGNENEQVEKRLRYLEKKGAHSSERVHRNGQTIRIEGNPLPDGGFVMMFSDITVYREAEKVLKEANLDLEARVAERTKTLERTNEALAIASAKAELAHAKKSQYLKACSHDLMQPIEAARLFTSALSEPKNLNEVQYRQIENIEHSLKVASSLITDLGDIAKIESGNIQPNLTAFALNDVFTALANEFNVMAEQQQVSFRVIPSTVWVTSDQHLLYRILQNLIGNAFRYASPGEIFLGEKVINDEVIIQVLDNGPGIPKEKQNEMFEQFTQLNNMSSISKGLGLGLYITQSLSEILGHELSLESDTDKGCKFSLTLDRTEVSFTPEVQPRYTIGFKDITVLCIDNDSAVLDGMIELLKMWECKVLSATTPKEAFRQLESHGDELSIVLADYQLDNNESGLILIQDIRAKLKKDIPSILITAADESGVQDKCESLDVGFMKKSIKPAMLRALMSSKLTQHLQHNYNQY